MRTYLERIACPDFRKQTEVAISRQQFFGSVRYADCRNPWRRGPSHHERAAAERTSGLLVRKSSVSPSNDTDGDAVQASI